jgi:spermidine/putrescine transport system permease protein
MHAAAGGGLDHGGGAARKAAQLSRRIVTQTRPRFGWLHIHAAAVFGFLYMPIVVLVVYSFNGESVGGFPPHGWTLGWYRILFEDDLLWAAVWNSVIVAGFAVVLSVLLGLPAALALDRTSFPGKVVFRRLVLLPLILPGIITGLSLLTLFAAVEIKLSLMTAAIGHGTALISVAVTEISAGLQKFDRAQEEASRDLGAGEWRTFRRVTLPNLKLPVIAAMLLVFTLSLDEIAVTFFLVGRENTLPLEIWSRLRRGITPEINAVSTLLFCFSLLTIVLWYKLRRKQPDE